MEYTINTALIIYCKGFLKDTHGENQYYLFCLNYDGREKRHVQLFSLYMSSYCNEDKREDHLVRTEVIGL